MHDTVGVVDGHGAILTETPPLEGRAERTGLNLLVLLLPGKFHKNLQDAQVQNEHPLVFVYSLQVILLFLNSERGTREREFFTYLLQGRLGEVVFFKVKSSFG